MRRSDELDKLTDDARAFLVEKLNLTDEDLSDIESLVEYNETHAALVGLYAQACGEGLLWPDHLVEQFRDLREKFVLEQEFEEFMECQGRIKAKTSTAPPDA